ncbi:hypothetical protein DSUL_20403 [Desulfovibrionales bacterium]
MVVILIYWETVLVMINRFRDKGLERIYNLMTWLGSLGIS